MLNMSKIKNDLISKSEFEINYLNKLKNDVIQELLDSGFMKSKYNSNDFKYYIDELDEKIYCTITVYIHDLKVKLKCSIESNNNRLTYSDKLDSCTNVTLKEIEQFILNTLVKYTVMIETN